VSACCQSDEHRTTASPSNFAFDLTRASVALRALSTLAAQRDTVGRTIREILIAMMGPAAISASRLAQEVGIGQPTLSKWLRDVEGRIGGVKFNSPPPRPRSPRRPEDWSAEERLRAVLEASRLPDDELGALLRREGITEAVLGEWKAAALDALGPQKKSTSDARKVRELEKQLRRKDKALAETAAILVLRKKLNAYWGNDSEDA